MQEVNNSVVYKVIPISIPTNVCIVWLIRNVQYT